MKTTLTPDSFEKLGSELAFTHNVTGSGRTPVHTVYGGAQLFTRETPGKLASIARGSLDKYASDDAAFEEIFGIPAEIAGVVRERVAAKLSDGAVEDFRIDFEDGYGVRSSEEEDKHAILAAEETAKAIENELLPAFFGIRIKALNGETGKRALRTLDLFLTRLVESTGGPIPSNFVVTLPKVSDPAEVWILTRALDEIENGLGLERASIGIEVMIETARAIFSPNGTLALPSIVDAADGRCVAAHFGAYDYLSELGIAASEQRLRHHACDLARNLMKLSLAGHAVDLSDGATNLMPVGLHRGADISNEQQAENASAVRAAWKLHYDNIRHGLANGFYRGWDLHPAQFVARYAAVYAFFLESLPSASERLWSFIEKGARANLVGNSFDDAATAQGLLGFFRRAVDCGAISGEDVMNKAGLSIEDIRSKSFAQIVRKAELSR